MPVVTFWNTSTKKNILVADLRVRWYIVERFVNERFGGKSLSNGRGDDFKLDGGGYGPSLKAWDDEKLKKKRKKCRKLLCLENMDEATDVRVGSGIEKGKDIGDIFNLIGLGKFPVLVKIVLHRLSVINEEHWKRVCGGLERCTTITEISIMDCVLSVRHTKWLCTGIVRMKQLTSLTMLNNPRLGRDGCGHILECVLGLESIEDVTLQNVGLDDSLIGLIGDVLQKCRGLDRLDMRFNDVTVRGYIQLITLMRQMKDLDLEYMGMCLSEDLHVSLLGKMPRGVKKMEWSDRGTMEQYRKITGTSTNDEMEMRKGMGTGFQTCLWNKLRNGDLSYVRILTLTGLRLDEFGYRELLCPNMVQLIVRECKVDDWNQVIGMLQTCLLLKVIDVSGQKLNGAEMKQIVIGIGKHMPHMRMLNHVYKKGLIGGYDIPDTVGECQILREWDGLLNVYDVDTIHRIEWIGDRSQMKLSETARRMVLACLEYGLLTGLEKVCLDGLEWNWKVWNGLRLCCKHVTEFILENVKLCSVMISILSRMQSLRVVDVGGCIMSHDVALDLCKIVHTWLQLRILRIPCVVLQSEIEHMLSDDFEIEFNVVKLEQQLKVKSITESTRIVCNENEWDDVALQELECVMKNGELRHVTHVELHGQIGSGRMREIVKGMRESESLEHVVLVDVDVGNGGRLGKTLKQLHRLDVLDITGCTMTKDVVICLLESIRNESDSKVRVVLNDVHVADCVELKVIQSDKIQLNFEYKQLLERVSAFDDVREIVCGCENEWNGLELHQLVDCLDCGMFANLQRMDVSEEYIARVLGVVRDIDGLEMMLRSSSGLAVDVVIGFVRSNRGLKMLDVRFCDGVDLDSLEQIGTELRKECVFVVKRTVLGALASKLECKVQKMSIVEKRLEWTSEKNEIMVANYGEKWIELKWIDWKTHVNEKFVFDLKKATRLAIFSAIYHQKMMNLNWIDLRNCNFSNDELLELIPVIEKCSSETVVFITGKQSFDFATLEQFIRVAKVNQVCIPRKFDPHLPELNKLAPEGCTVYVSLF